MGNLSEVVSALAAVGALVAAVWAGLTAKKLYDMETRRDEMSSELQRRRAASRVSAWVCTHFPEGVNEGANRRDGVIIANQGDCPIYDVRIESTGKDGLQKKEIVQHVLPPGEYFVGSRSDAFQWDSPDQTQCLEGIIRPITKKPDWRVTQLKFQDADGNRWLRDERGRLGGDTPLTAASATRPR
ncbi:hypothetical protein ACTQ49_02135 [Luteococcus sp. Sow4_B9]|uniref:hypothetical protein n=1 Tax=Luteococcus sp. Sow4_B9 TaxID=3438792 RepID=UPI003F94B737